MPLSDIKDPYQQKPEGLDPVAQPRYEGGVRPVPDPTVLTTQQLFREITNLRELLETRLAGYDKAIVLLQAKADKSPSIPEIVERLDALSKHVDVAASQAKLLNDERFASIQQQFVERDTRTDQTSRDSKVAVDAALQAAKEAVGEQNRSNALAIAKSETTFTKRIDQIGSLITQMGEGFNSKVDDLKQRLATIEAGGNASNQTLLWVAVVGFAVLAVVYVLFKGGA